ncbi:MAG: hypothetical protein ACK5LJ_13860 [Paracoccus sp. (in: a-proteobacteria)]
MGLIRPELRDWLHHHRELLAAIGCMLISLWVMIWGGWFYAALGLAAAGASLLWVRGSWRRRAFHRKIAAPGVLEVVEGEIRYFAARALGGSIALRDLVEIRLLRLDGHDHWRLKSRTGEALLVPVEARGAQLLADAFTALPGFDFGQASAALAQKDGPSLRILWQRAGA